MQSRAVGYYGLPDEVGQLRDALSQLLERIVAILNHHEAGSFEHIAGKYKSLSVTEGVDMQNSQIKNLDAVLLNATKTVTPDAMAGTYGAVQSVTPITDAYSLMPIGIVVSTTQGAETLTVRITAKFSDNATQSWSRDFTTSETHELTVQELTFAFADGKTLIQLDVDCASSINNSTASADVQVIGRYY